MRWRSALLQWRYLSVGNRQGRACRNLSIAARPGAATGAIAFDIDGVLIRGKEVIPQAREALHMLAPRAWGGKELAQLPFSFLTNGGGVSEARKAEELSQWFGLQFPASSVCQSHTPMQSLLHKYGDCKILVLGMTDVKSVALQYGFREVVTMGELASKHPELVPHLVHEEPGGDRVQPRSVHRSESPKSSPDLSSIRAVFVMHDPNQWYRDCQILLDVMTAAEPPPQLFFTNPDFLFSGRWSSPRLAQGAFRTAFSSLYSEYTGRALPYSLMGKPEKITFDWAASMLTTRAHSMGYSSIDEYYMIGDNPTADIRGANRAHWTSIFVRTGTLKPSDRPEDQPQHVADNVLEAVKWIVERERNKRR